MYVMTSAVCDDICCTFTKATQGYIVMGGSICTNTHDNDLNYCYTKTKEGNKRGCHVVKYLLCVASTHKRIAP